MDQQHSPQHHFTYRDVSSDSTELSNRKNNNSNMNNNSSNVSPRTDAMYTSGYWNTEEHYVDSGSYDYDHDNHQYNMNTHSSKAPFMSLNGFCVRMLFITCYLQLLLTRWNAVDGTPTLKVFFTYNLHTEVFQYRTHMIQVMSWLGCWFLFWVLLLNIYFLNMHYHKCRDKLHIDAANPSMVTDVNELIDDEEHF